VSSTLAQLSGRSQKILPTPVLPRWLRDVGPNESRSE
jgi:hypothetical protein